MIFLPYLVNRLDGYQALSQAPLVLQLSLFNCHEYIPLVSNFEIGTDQCASSVDKSIIPMATASILVLAQV